jgi:uncharacterized protein YbjT (DUF2867 family)
MTAPVLVLGATGTTGSRVARELRRRGVPIRQASRTAPGMTRFDWQDPTTWRPALNGVQRLYLVAPTDGADPAPVVARFLTAAADTGLQRVVLLSSSALQPAPAGPGALPSLVRAAVPEWAILRPSWFMTNLLGDTPLAIGLRAGEVITATGAGRVAFVDPDDIAAVTAQALIAEPSLNAELVLTGPDTFSYPEVCDLVAAQRGHPIDHHSRTVQEYTDHLIRAGVPAAYAPLLAGLDESISHGSEDRVTATVEQIAGRPAGSLRDFVLRHATELAA